MTIPEYITEEYQITDEDLVVIEWDGEARMIRGYTRGTSKPIYVGNSLDELSNVMGIPMDVLAHGLMSDPVVRDRNGQMIS